MTAFKRFAALFVSLLFFAITLLGQGRDTKSKFDVVRTFKGHTEAVYAVGFTPDGKYLATGSFDFTVKLWDPATGKELRTFAGPNGHTKNVTCLAISNDGLSLASGGSDNIVRVWDIPASRPFRSLPAADQVTAVTASVDGAKIALGTKDGKVVVVAAADNKELAKFEGHVGAVTALSFSANGNVLVSGGADQTLRYHDLLKNVFLTSVGGHRGGVVSVAALPSLYSTGKDGLLKQWPLAPTPSKPLPAHPAAIVASTVSPDGTQLATVSADKTLRHISIPTGKEIRNIPNLPAEVTQLTFNAGNTLLAGAGADGKWYLWNVADGKLLSGVLAHTGKTEAITFQAAQIATAGSDGLVKLWAPPLATKFAVHPTEVTFAIPLGDAKRIVTAGTDKTIRLWEMTKLAADKAFPVQPTAVTSLAVNPPATILATGDPEGRLRLWNVATTKEAESLLGHTKAITANVFGAAASFTASEDGSVKAWTMPIVGPKEFPFPDTISVVAVTADGKFVTGGVDKTLRLWNATTGAKEKEIAGATGALTAVAMNATHAAAGSADKTLFVWNANDKAVLLKAPMPSAIGAVAFSPDAQFVSAGLADGTIQTFKIADLKMGKEFKILDAKKGAIHSLAYSIKGDILYAGCADKAIVGLSPADGSVKSKFDLAGPATQVLPSKDGLRLAGVTAKHAKVWTLADNKEVLGIESPTEIKHAGISPDGKRVALSSTDNFARLYDETGAFLERFQQDAPAPFVHLLDAKKLVTLGAEKKLRHWTSHVLWQKSSPAPVRALALSSRGDHLLAAGDDKAIRFYNVADGKELRVLPAHDSPVSHLALSGDSLRLVSTSADKKVKVWSLTTKPEEAKILTEIVMPTAPTSVAVVSSGLRVAVALGVETTVFDAVSGKELQRFVEHTGPIKALAFLPDQKTLLTGSADKNAKLLDVSATAVFAAHAGGTSFVQFNAAGQQLLTAGADKLVKLWDFPKLTESKKFGPFPAPLTQVTLHRDNTQIGVAYGKTVKFIVIADGKEFLNLEHPADVVSFATVANKARIVTSARDKNVRIFDGVKGLEQQFLETSEQPQNVYAENATGATYLVLAGKSATVETPIFQKMTTVEPGAVSAMTPTPNLQSMLIVGPDKAVKQWSLNTFLVEKSYPLLTAQPRAVAASKTGSMVAVGGDDKTITVFTVADGKEYAKIKVDEPVRNLGFTANSQLLLVQLGDKKLAAFFTNFVANQPVPADFLQTVQSFEIPEGVNDMALLADNASFLTAGADKKLNLWKIASPSPVKTFNLNSSVDALAFHPKGNILVAGSHDGRLRYYDLAKNAVLKEILAHVDVKNNNTPYPVYSVSLNADGTKVLTCSSDKTMKIYDLPGGALLKEFKAYNEKEFPKGHQEDIYSAVLSPDGKFIASASGGLENVIKIWNADGTVVRDLAHPELKSPNPTQAIPSSPGRLNQIAFTKDGKYLVSVGLAPKNRGFLALWSVADGKMISGETLPMGAFYALAFSEDEKWIAVASGNNGRPVGDHNVVRLLKNPLK